MSLSETIDPADIPLFRYMPDDVRDLVVASLDQVSYRFGSVIVRDGDPSDALYIIVSGRARVVKVGDNGEEVTLDTLERGDTVRGAGTPLRDNPARRRCGPAPSWRSCAWTRPSSGA